MINPFFIFIASFLAILIAYTFGFSDIYPDLSISLLFFLVVIFIVMGIIGYWIKKKKVIEWQPIKANTNIVLATVLVLALIIIEGIYSKGLPLTNMLLGRDSGYSEFGVPTVHVIIMTFSAFLSTYIFQLLISKFSIKFLILYLVSLLPNILVVNRGMLMMILMNCLWVFLIAMGRKIKFYHIISVLVLGFFGLYAFGIMGNARLNASYQTGKNSFDTSTFMDIGKASDSFKNSVIPEPFFWTYVYATSPIANLQKNISENNTEPKPGLEEFNGFVFNELIPDFIGKRVVAGKNYETVETKQITQELNVSTAFVGPYKWLGWTGMLVYTLIMILFSIVYLLLLKNISKQFFIIGLSILNTVFLFSFFTNMMSFTGLIFQLVYPIFFTIWNLWCEKKKFYQFRL